MHIAVKLTVFAVVALLPSCATLFAGGPDLVQVTSDPPGARVTVRGESAGTTPCVISLKRPIGGGGTAITIANGNRSERPLVTQSMNPVAIIDFLFLPGLIVDGLTGNVWRHDTSPIHVILK